MLTFSADVNLSTAQKRQTLRPKLNRLLSRTDITQDQNKRAILTGLLSYLDIVENRWLKQTSSMRIDAIYQIADVLDKSNLHSDFYTAIACKVSYNQCFFSQGDIDNSSLSQKAAVPIHNYYSSVAVPKLNMYRNAGMNLFVTCFMATLFTPNYLPMHNVLHGGLVLGLAMLSFALIVPMIPDLAKLDKVFSDNPQLLTMLDNVANVAGNSLRLVNAGLNQMNNRLTM